MKSNRCRLALLLLATTAVKESSAATSDLSSMLALPPGVCPLTQSSGVSGNDYGLEYRTKHLLRRRGDEEEEIIIEQQMDVNVGAHYQGQEPLLDLDTAGGGLSVEISRQDSGGWIVEKAIYDGTTNISWPATLSSTASSSSDLGVNDTGHYFWCDVVDISLPNHDADEFLRLLEFRMYAYGDSEQFNNYQSNTCSLSVVSPCPDDQICHMMDGTVHCITPDDQENGYGSSSPIMEGLTRSDYIEKYWCADNNVLPNRTPKELLYWQARGAFLQAENVQVSIFNHEQREEDLYTFRDDSNQPATIDSGTEGEQLQRDIWNEGGYQRRMKFAFATVTDTTDSAVMSKQPYAEKSGWYLQSLDVYGNNEAWMYSMRFDNTVGLQVPTSNFVFHCDRIELDLFDSDPTTTTDVTTTTTTGANNPIRGSFAADNVYLAAYKDPNVSTCDLLHVENPCHKVAGREFCHFSNGVLDCIEPPVTNPETEENTDMDTISASTTRTTSKERRKQTEAGLLCEAPKEVFPKEIPPSNVTIHWTSQQQSLVYATNVSVIYKDGTVLSFEDEKGREPCYVGGDAVMGRTYYWYEFGIARSLEFATDLSSIRLSPNYYQKWTDVKLEWTKPGTVPNVVPPDLEPNTVFVCESVQFDLYNPDLDIYEENQEEDEDQQEQQQEEGADGDVALASSKSNSDQQMPAEAKFSARNFAIGGNLEPGFDICSLRVYKPCGQDSCSLTNGVLECIPNNDGAQDGSSSNPFGSLKDCSDDPTNGESESGNGSDETTDITSDGVEESAGTSSGLKRMPLLPISLLSIFLAHANI